MELLDHFLLVLISSDVEPLIKGLCRAKNLRQKKIQKGPQLMKVVLQVEKEEGEEKGNGVRKGGM